MSGSSRRVVVIGGGVIGISCAHYLSKSGWQVTVIDKGAVGGGSSGGNCGLVCPSHVLPLAEPGMVSKGLASLLQKNSPLAIKFRLSPSLWSWLIHFSLRCNRRDMMASGRGIQPLLESSLELYQELVGREGIHCEWQKKGLLFPYKSRALLDAYAPTDQLLTDSFHCPAKQLIGDDLLALEPSLKPGLAGGWYYEDDAHLRPDRLLDSWKKAVQASGVEILENRGFLGFRKANGAVAAVETTNGDGELAADAFVVATGAWTPLLREQIGCNVPIQPGKGYSVTMPRPASCPSIPMIFPETRVAVTPFDTGFRLGSTMEFSGYDTTINQSRLQLLHDGALPYLRDLGAGPVEQTWYGWRPMTWDGLPVIDRSPAFGNVMIAAGHNMLGLSMAPATGKLVAELLNETKPFLDVTPYRASRF